MRMIKWFIVGVIVLFASGLYGAEPDKGFLQPVSVKYKLNEDIKGATMQKIVVDYDNNVFVLSNKGLLRGFGDVLAKDNLYSPLSKRVPVDICLQEKTQYIYYLYDDKWLTNAYAGVPYGNLKKGKHKKIAVSADGTVYLAGDKVVTMVSEGKEKEIKIPDGSLKAVYIHNGTFFTLINNTIYRLANQSKFVELHKKSSINSVAFRNNEVLIGSPEGYYGIDISSGKETFALQTKVPVPDIRSIVVNNKGLWAGTPQGAFLREPSGNFRYFASKRWLNRDKVIDMASDNEGNLFLLTPSGLNKVVYKEMTLAKKAAFFQNKIRQRHMRYGFSSELHLKVPGDVTTAVATDTDNDGSWTSFWLGSQALRYAVTGEEIALRYAWESFEAYERLHSVNQMDGFPSRTFERKGFKYSDVDRWRDSPDPEWEWKGHTSADEFVSYLFVTFMMDKFVVKTESERARIAHFFDQVMNHLLENDYYFTDIDGKPTKWGRWNPEYVNWFPKTIVDRRTRSVELIAGLQMAYALTGKEIYKTEAYRMINEHGYLDNMLMDVNKFKETPGYIHDGADMGMGGWNHVDDHLAFMSYWVLTSYAFPEFKESYKRAIQNHWEVEKVERNALWNMIAYASSGLNDEASIFWHLREYPLDLVRYKINNSHRKDLIFSPPNFRNDYLSTPLSPMERCMHRHNTSSFQVDAGFFDQDVRELCGDEYLLPYWMARYFEIIKEE
ncbi:hypothetical protein GCM10027284_04590 [Cyclobacterium sediminis]